MSSVQETIDALHASRKNVRCADICGRLRKLGFDVREGSGPGHKVVGHRGLRGFTGSNFNCGHGKNPQVLPVYVKHVIALLEHWKIDIEEYIHG